MISGSAGNKLSMLVRARTLGSIVLSLQMLVRVRTWGSIACLYKCWLELGHGGLLPVFTNAG